MATINGRAKRYDGNPIDYVSIFQWKTGRCLAQIAPDSAGNWAFDYDTNMIVGITHIADGCEPITHGPYEFVLNK